MTGHSSDQARRLLEEHGPNEITRHGRARAWPLLVAQLRGTMILILLGACALSAVLGEVADAVAIAAIVVVNALVGFFQEYRAEKAVLALRSLAAPRARVFRDGALVTIATAEVVPGDVLALEAGDLVAADAELVEAHALEANEAALTGESVPVAKRAEPIAQSAPLAERTDRVFMGTAVTRGSGAARVTATGMRTELGRIAGLLATVEEPPTPLQVRLEKVGRHLLWICLGIVAVVAAVGLLRGGSWLEVLLSSVSLAVAAVPEGLAAIVTIALAVGLQRMAARNVLVRKLPAVETLGCATVICTDKTGTLTTGVMETRELWGRDHDLVVEVAAACCDAELTRGSDTEGTGDPTEIAILVEARRRGIEREALERERPRQSVAPFDSDRKRMSIFRADGVLYVKGALESLLPRCTSGADGAPAANAELAARGLRVLAVARGRGPAEEDLELVGLIGLADPPRPSAIAAVGRARAAGITTVMITGDHAVTARAIAREVGILGPGDDPEVVVHARATASDKLDIVRDWIRRGAVVAMTGDGVNDAPALREAHIGVAMGRTGSEVTREAADMVLTDDDFASIVAAVQQGRGIYENIRKALAWMLGGNAGELMLMLVASLLGFPLPLLPLQLLWINLVTDGLPALALVMDPAHPDVLKRPPRDPREPLLRRRDWTGIVIVGAMEAALALAVFAWALETHGLDAARSHAFSVVVFAQLARSFAARSADRIYWEVGIASNLALVAIVVLSVGLHLTLFAFEPTRALFGLAPMSLPGWIATGLVGLVPVTVIELAKLLRRLRR